MYTVRSVFTQSKDNFPFDCVYNSIIQCSHGNSETKNKIIPLKLFRVGVKAYLDNDVITRARARVRMYANVDITLRPGVDGSVCLCMAESGVDFTCFAYFHLSLHDSNEFLFNLNAISLSVKLSLC